MDENTSEAVADQPDFTKDVKEMVADHAPRRFAVVLVHGDQVDAEIFAWGIALEVGSYMTTVDGKRQYSMTSADGALKYAPRRPDLTPQLVWADAETPE
ncbi:hypothetical protein [Kibdelosporangium aridum]|uniref:hypothetical protein n=1 Tax=Kibdelosporangium aridum TaxID=2030 RepID=UPI000525EA1D